MGDYNFELGANGGRETIGEPARFIRLTDTDVDNAAVWVETNGGDRYRLTEGRGVPLAFDTDRIIVINNESQAQNVRIFVGPQPDVDYSLAGNIDAVIVQGNTVTDPAATSVGSGAAVQIAASSANRKSVRFVNEHSSQVRIGGSGVTTTTGIPLDPGAVWVETEGAAAEWYAISTSGTGDVVTQEVS